MSDKTGIEWTDATWNPVRGCSRVSEGCRHCYAEQVAARFSGLGMPYEGLAKRVGGEERWTGKVRMVPEHLHDPLRWQRPRRIFVNSMSDLFHEGLTDDQIDSIFAVMGAAPQHSYQVLTKRPARMLEWSRGAEERVAAAGDRLAAEMGWCHANEGGPWPLPQVWLGVSVEDQATADERIPLLLQSPAAVRFVSYEPALGPVNFRGGAYGPDWLEGWYVEPVCCNRPVGDPPSCCGGPDAEQVRSEHLDWIIVGGESGREARPFNVAWAEATIEQCRATGVACFVKQLGAETFEPSDAARGRWGAGVRVNVATGCPAGPRNWVRLSDSKGGDWSEWPEDLRVRQYPGTTA